MVMQKKDQAALSWKRAKRLATLADHDKSSDARSYIATLNASANITDLDTLLDRRTATIRDLIEGFKS